MIVPFICLSFYILLMLTTGKLWLVRCLGSMSRFCSRPQSSWRRVVTKLTIGFWFSPPTGCLSWQPRNWSLFWAVKEPCKNVKSKSLQLSTYLPLGPQMILDTYILMIPIACYCLLYFIALLNTKHGWIRFLPKSTNIITILTFNQSSQRRTTRSCSE